MNGLTVYTPSWWGKAEHLDFILRNPQWEQLQPDVVFRKHLIPATFNIESLCPPNLEEARIASNRWKENGD
jgi:hypothetical protein